MKRIPCAASRGRAIAIVAYKGRIVAEWYGEGEGPQSVFEVWSVSKSIDDPVSRHVPAWKRGRKGREGEIVTPPGEVSLYDNAACNVLSAVISAAAGGDLEASMLRKVWEPIGMRRTRWRRDRANHVISYASIRTTARDLTRFGLLFLHGDTWEGKRIISRGWIGMATRERTRIRVGPLRLGPYGLLWWLDFGKGEAPHNYSALGLYGNDLTVIPALELVGVRLVGSHAEGGGFMFRTAEWVEALAGVVPGKKGTE